MISHVFTHTLGEAFGKEITSKIFHRHCSTIFEEGTFDVTHNTASRLEQSDDLIAHVIICDTP